MDTRRYFSAESAHGSSTSHGFSNDTIVLAFDSRAARDSYVEQSDNLSCEAIPARKATRCAANVSLTSNCVIRPRPFTTEFWGIVADEFDVPGCIGRLEVCDDADPCIAERFYR